MSGNQPPLNPDAIASMARIHFESGRTDHRKWEHLYPEIQETLIAEMRPYAESALAVAQPVVNSVEELDALPVGSVVRGGEDDLVGEKIRLSPYLPHWCTIGEEVEADKRDLLPARVLYRPEVSDA